MNRIKLHLDAPCVLIHVFKIPLTTQHNQWFPILGGSYEAILSPSFQNMLSATFNSCSCWWWNQSPLKKVFSSTIQLKSKEGLTVFKSTKYSKKNLQRLVKNLPIGWRPMALQIPYVGPPLLLLIFFTLSLNTSILICGSWSSHKNW